MRAESAALRNELLAAQKRAEDVEERLRVAAHKQSGPRGAANGMSTGFMSNKKVLLLLAHDTGWPHELQTRHRAQECRSHPPGCQHLDALRCGKHKSTLPQ